MPVPAALAQRSVSMSQMRGGTKNQSHRLQTILHEEDVWLSSGLALTFQCNARGPYLRGLNRVGHASRLAHSYPMP